MPEVVKTVIGDVEFSVEMMHATTAGEIGMRLQNIIAPILAAHTEYKENHTATWIAEAVAGYLVSCNQYADIHEISKKILWNTHIVYVSGDKAGSGKLDFKPSTPERLNNDPFCFDNFFSRKLDLLFQLLFFAVMENYPGFFGRVSWAIQILRMASKEETELKEMQELGGESNEQELSS